jgi:hypothetical protein
MTDINCMLSDIVMDRGRTAILDAIEYALEIERREYLCDDLGAILNVGQIIQRIAESMEAGIFPPRR